MPNSRAFLQFGESLTMAEELLRIESKYQDPPKQTKRKAVQGLRGGAVVLMAAAFENFLRQAFEEHLSELTVHPRVLYWIQKTGHNLRQSNQFMAG